MNFHASHVPAIDEDIIPVNLKSFPPSSSPVSSEHPVHQPPSPYTLPQQPLHPLAVGGVPSNEVLRRKPSKQRGNVNVSSLRLYSDPVERDATSSLSGHDVNARSVPLTDRLVPHGVQLSSVPSITSDAPTSAYGVLHQQRNMASVLHNIATGNVISSHLPIQSTSSIHAPTSQLQRRAISSPFSGPSVVPRVDPAVSRVVQKPAVSMCKEEAFSVSPGPSVSKDSSKHSITTKISDSDQQSPSPVVVKKEDISNDSLCCEYLVPTKGPPSKVLSSSAVSSQYIPPSSNVKVEDDEEDWPLEPGDGNVENRRAMRAERNRQSAAASRERKKHHIKDLEVRVSSLSQKSAQILVTQLQDLSKEFVGKKSLEGRLHKLNNFITFCDLELQLLNGKLGGGNRHNLKRMKSWG